MKPLSPLQRELLLGAIQTEKTYYARPPSPDVLTNQWRTLEELRVLVLNDRLVIKDSDLCPLCHVRANERCHSVGRYDCPRGPGEPN